MASHLSYFWAYQFGIDDDVRNFLNFISSLNELPCNLFELLSSHQFGILLRSKQGSTEVLKDFSTKVLKNFSIKVLRNFSMKVLKNFSTKELKNLSKKVLKNFSTKVSITAV